MSPHFISYSRSDAAFARRLISALHKAGIDIWIDTGDIKAGRHWDQAVEDALNAAETLILLLSPHSVASENVKDEVSYAMEKGKDIIPILISPCQIPMRLARRQYIDFTGDYETALQQLLSALNVTAKEERADPELELWQAARKKHRTGAYQDYLKKYSTGKYAAEAGAFILQLKAQDREKALWQEARKEDTVTAYEYYLSESTLQTHKKEAAQKIKDGKRVSKEKSFSIPLTIGLFVLGLIVLFIWKPWSGHKETETIVNYNLPELYMRQYPPVIIPDLPRLQGLHSRAWDRPFLLKADEKPALSRTEDWFRNNGLPLNYYNNGDLPAPQQIPRSYKTQYRLIAGGNFKDYDNQIFYYGSTFDQVRYLLITNGTADSVLHFLDFGQFMNTTGQGGVRWSVLWGNTLYISQYSLKDGSTFDSRITAIDLKNNSILWTSADRSANSDQFLVGPNYIFSGYGNDAGDNHLVLLYRSNGSNANQFKTPGKVSLIAFKNNNYYVRTSSADLVYTLSVLMSPGPQER